jgi:hypothetical protein
MLAIARFRAGTRLLLALVMLGAYVAPATAAAGLRAARCCAEHCAHPRSVSAASQCCQVVQDSFDVGAFSSSEHSQHFRGLAVVAIVTTADLPARLISSRFISPDSRLSRAAPIFLETLSLRL